MAVDTKAFRDACGQFLTGVTIVTTRTGEGAPVGLTANSFASVSLDPPLVLVCVDRNASGYAAFEGAQAYAVHVLPAEAKELSSRFASRGIDRFAGVEWSDGLYGLPLLPEYLTRIECRIAHRYEGGDHTIFVGHVERFTVAEGEQEPLGFFRGRYTTAPS